MKLTNENSTLCVWLATVVVTDEVPDFNKWLADAFSVDGEYAESFTTLPDETPGSGGRVDTLFRVANDDVPKFAVPRLAYGIRWWSDYITDSRDIVPKAIIERYAGDEA